MNNTGYGASAAWVDYDKDGKLDLFVTNYVKWSEKEDLYCTLDGRHKSYCTPEAYKGDTPGSFITSATAASKTSPRRQASTTPPANRWAWR